MVCTTPRIGRLIIDSAGKKRLSFSRAETEAFYQGGRALSKDTIRLPCGQCLGCRIARARTWALRMAHEASLHEASSFVTLTVSDDHMPEVFPNFSLSKIPLQLFLKRLRKVIDPCKIRYFACGEYGDLSLRPHYHLCLFGYDFSADRFIFKHGQKPLWRSPLLEKLWPHGMSTIGALTPETAAYVAGYCLKKVVGKKAPDHYQGRMPEFASMSLKPGLGAGWYEKYGVTDVDPFDEVICKEVAVKPPPYYDKLRAKKNAQEMLEVKEARKIAAEERADLSTIKTLTAKGKMLEASVNLKTKPI